ATQITLCPSAGPPRPERCTLLAPAEHRQLRPGARRRPDSRMGIHRAKGKPAYMTMARRCGEAAGPLPFSGECPSSYPELHLENMFYDEPVLAGDQGHAPVRAGISVPEAAARPRQPRP